jgi:hypothetical protein
LENSILTKPHEEMPFCYNSVFKLKDQFHLYTGTLVKSNLGVAKLTPGDLSFLNAKTYPDFEGKYNQVTSTFLVPVFAKYDFKNNFYIEAGPQFGLMHKAYVEFNSDSEGIEAKVREFNTDKIHHLDARIGGGFGYTLFKGEGISIGFKYYHGFVDVYKDKSGTKNNSFNIKMNVRIGASKKDKQKNNSK